MGQTLLVIFSWAVLIFTSGINLYLLMYMALKKKDFILYRENSKIKSGGYTVNSILLHKNKKIKN